MSQYHDGTAYRWSDMPWENVRAGVRRAAFGNDRVSLVMNEIAPGHEPHPHSHPTFFQIATIVSGTGVYVVGGTENQVGPGSVLLIPPGNEHFIRNSGDEPILNLDVFSPARADLAHLTQWMRR